MILRLLNLYIDHPSNLSFKLYDILTILAAFGDTNKPLLRDVSDLLSVINTTVIVTEIDSMIMYNMLEVIITTIYSSILLYYIQYHTKPDLTST